MREREHWGARLEQDKEAQINLRPIALRLKVKEGEERQSAMQELADEWWKTHDCTQGNNCFDGETFINKLSLILDSVGDPLQYKIEVITLEHRFVIGLRAWSCKACGQHVELDPQAVHCFPGTPCKARVWIDKSIFELMRTLGPKSGTPWTSFLDGLQKMQEQNGQDCSTDLRASWMERIFCAWLEVRTGIEIDSDLFKIMPTRQAPSASAPSVLSFEEERTYCIEGVAALICATRPASLPSLV